MHRLFLGVLLALSSNSFAMDPSMPSGNFLGKGRSKQVNLLCNESSSRPFPCTTTSKGSKPQPCSLNSKVVSGAAGHWQVAQDQSASSSPQRKSLLVGPSIFKPTGTPTLQQAYLAPVLHLAPEEILGYSGRPQSVCVGLTQFQWDLASRAVFKPRPVMHSVTKALEVILPSRFAYIAIPPSNNALTPRHATVETIAHAVVQDLHVLATKCARTVVDTFNRDLSASGQVETSEHWDCWINVGLIVGFFQHKSSINPDYHDCWIFFWWLTCWALPWEYICWVISKCQGHHKSAFFRGIVKYETLSKGWGFLKSWASTCFNQGISEQVAGIFEDNIVHIFWKRALWSHHFNDTSATQTPQWTHPPREETASRVQQDSGCQWFPSPWIFFSNAKAPLDRPQRAADLPCISPRSWWVLRSWWDIRRSASSPPRDCRRWRSCKCHHHIFQSSHLCLCHLVNCEEWGSEEVEWMIMESF